MDDRTSDGHFSGCCGRPIMRNSVFDGSRKRKLDEKTTKTTLDI